MPPSDKVSAQATLEVRPSDAQAEIFIIDSDGKLVDRGVGPANFTLAPGIYKVKVRTGSEFQEAHAILRPGESGPVRCHFKETSFPSPAPLDTTAKTHEYHIDAAIKECQTPHVSVGRGSFIFIFARDWTPPGHKRADLDGSPARGLRLYGENDPTPVVDIEAKARTSLQKDPWAACNVAVDPGNYQLRLELGTGEWLATTIVASPRWQTQVFLLLRDYKIPNADQTEIAVRRRADLAGASVLHSQTGFDPHRPVLRRAELARQSLSYKAPTASLIAEPPTERLLPDEVRDLLEHKLENPILGIYGAHLLLLEAKPDLRLLEIVVGNLRKLLGRAHPDVEALALPLGKPAPEARKAFGTPPMLRRSWSLIVDATLDDPDLVPAQSQASRVADRLWHEGAWHVWRGRTPTGAMIVDQSDAIVDVLAGRLQRKAAHADTAPGVGGLERRSKAKRAMRAPVGKVATLSDREMRGLARAFGIPRHKMDSLLKEAAAQGPTQAAIRPPAKAAMPARKAAVKAAHKRGKGRA